jgi:hypothetical protein
VPLLPAFHLNALVFWQVGPLLFVLNRTVCKLFVGFQGRLLDNLQESEIESLTILQGVESSEVKGVLPRKRKVRPVGIEPTTLDLGSRTTLESKALETKHDEHFTKSQGHLEGHQNFSDERFNELSNAWSTLPKSTQLGILALYDIAKTNSQERGISGIIGTMPPKAESEAESPCPSRTRK